MPHTKIMASYSEIWGVQGGFQENFKVSIRLIYVNLRKEFNLGTKQEIIVGFNNKTKVIDLIPITAIKWFCMECTGYGKNETKLCPIYLCPFYPYRSSEGKVRNTIYHDIRQKKVDKNGNITIEVETVKLTPLRAIRYYCKECCGFENLYKELTNCKMNKCPIWIYRHGNNPALSKIKKEK